MRNEVGLFWGEQNYPERSDYFDENNHIFKLIETGFREMGLDAGHYGSPEWNPLSAYISPGDNVLIKPNMVLHANNGDGGVECLYTHPSLVVPVIKYVARALNGTGEIVVGDAPLQRCDFMKLITESGYYEIVETYKKRGVNITLVDFRNVKVYIEGSVRYLQESKKEGGCIVRLENTSAFEGVEKNKIDRFRITGYSPGTLNTHHGEGFHEYKVSEYLLNADVVINMPKPKTHRKAGITAALKNMVGINASKEFLPHHTSLGTGDNGDEYEGSSEWHNLASRLLDIKNELNDKGEYELARETTLIYEKCFKRAIDQSATGYSEGSWYGNDTIWRTIQDLNYILFHSDKNGILHDDIQRKVFVIGDMIIAGEEEGPLEPSPKPMGLICMGENPVMIDRTVAEVMGFDWMRIPSLCRVSIGGISSDDKDRVVITNDENRRVSKFEPSLGWIAALGSDTNDTALEKCKESSKPVYVFGAFPGGRRIADRLMADGVKVEAFLDNNEKKHEEGNYNNIPVLYPREAENDRVVISAVSKEHSESIKEQLNKCGFESVYIMR